MCSSSSLSQSRSRRQRAVPPWTPPSHATCWRRGAASSPAAVSTVSTNVPEPPAGGGRPYVPSPASRVGGARSQRAARGGLESALGREGDLEVVAVVLGHGE